MSQDGLPPHHPAPDSLPFREFETVLRALAGAMSNENIRSAMAGLGRWLVEISQPQAPAALDSAARVELPHVERLLRLALVLLAIRWSSHSFGEVRQMCERHGKLFVRLPGGYGVNQIAQQILAQVGRQLEGTPRTHRAADAAT